MKTSLARITSPLVLSRNVNWETIQMIFLVSNTHDFGKEAVSIPLTAFLNSNPQSNQNVAFCHDDFRTPEGMPKELILMGPYPDGGYKVVESDEEITVEKRGAVLNIVRNCVSEVLITDDPKGDFEETCLRLGHDVSEDNLRLGVAEIEDDFLVAYGQPDEPSENLLLESEWDKRYVPLDNQIDTNASFNGAMFETFGDELDFVMKQNPNHVWTYQDDDNGSPCITSGFHVVNRIGYFVTQRPWIRDTYVSLKHS